MATGFPVLGGAIAHLPGRIAKSQGFVPIFTLALRLIDRGARVLMRTKILVAAAAGIVGLATAAATGAAEVMEKDEVAVGVPVENATPEIGIRDEAMMVLVGSALIGAAAAVRRAA